MLVLIVTILLFLLGLFFISRSDKIEGLANMKIKHRCPNILLEKNKKFYLYNSRLAKVPGVNPLEFDNLEDYVEFMEWQRSQGIKCPVLYLQHAYNAQGSPVYKFRTGATEFQPGLPDSSIGLPDAPMGQVPAPVTKLFDASRDNPPYNQGEYPGYDPGDQYIGLETPLDKMFNAPNNTVSANPMDITWGGQEYTQEKVDSGAYKGDEVYLEVP
jgi:hypothetical protein